MAKIAMFSTLAGTIVHFFGNSQTLADGIMNYFVIRTRSRDYLVVIIDACRVIFRQVMSVTHLIC